PAVPRCRFRFQLNYSFGRNLAWQSLQELFPFFIASPAAATSDFLKAAEAAVIWTWNSFENFCHSAISSGLLLFTSWVSACAARASTAMTLASRASSSPCPGIKGLLPRVARLTLPLRLLISFITEPSLASLFHSCSGL